MKYQLTEETLQWCGRTLYRIQALKDFNCQGRLVKAGDLGGWIGQESNLSQEGTCWVSDSAWVYDSAKVSGSAWVFDSAKVYGSAKVFGSALVHGSAQIFDSAKVYGSAWVSGSAQVFGSARVSSLAWVFGSAQVHGQAQVFGSTQVSGSAQVSDSARVFGSAQIFDSAKVYGSAWVSGSAQVFGSARLRADKWTHSPLVVQGTRDILCTVSHTEVTVGCETHPIDWWLQHYETIGKKHEYTPKEIEEYKFHLQHAKRWLETL